ncbi:MAG: hypothetical protein JWQ27_1246 [Ferruginibacter sp.]|nr:hypothetical protein [Ferruginibacter sp.]
MCERLLCYGIFFALLFPANVAAQSPLPEGTKAVQYIEGAKLVIDVLKLFRQNKPPATSLAAGKNSGFCSFCVFNSDTTNTIKVMLVEKVVPATAAIFLIIKPSARECLLRINCGIYNCRVESLKGEVISWGDISVADQMLELKK